MDDVIGCCRLSACGWHHVVACDSAWLCFLVTNMRCSKGVLHWPRTVFFTHVSCFVHRDTWLRLGSVWEVASEDMAPFCPSQEYPRLPALPSRWAGCGVHPDLSVHPVCPQVSPSLFHHPAYFSLPYLPVYQPSPCPQCPVCFWSQHSPISTILSPLMSFLFSMLGY